MQDTLQFRLERMKEINSRTSKCFRKMCHAQPEVFSNSYAVAFLSEELHELSYAIYILEDKKEISFELIDVLSIIFLFLPIDSNRVEIAKRLLANLMVPKVPLEDHFNEWYRNVLSRGYGIMDDENLLSFISECL